MLKKGHLIKPIAHFQSQEANAEEARSPDEGEVSLVGVNEGVLAGEVVAEKNGTIFKTKIGHYKMNKIFLYKKQIDT